MTTLETIQEILNENLDIDPTTVAADSTFESLGIDSLDMVELVCEIENRFDIELGEALPYCIAVAKGDPKGLLPGINEAIADMLKNNKVDEFIADADSLADVAVEVTAEG